MEDRFPETYRRGPLDGFNPKDVPLIPEHDPSLPYERPERRVPIQPRVPPPKQDVPGSPERGVEIITPGTDVGTRIEMQYDF